MGINTAADAGKECADGKGHDLVIGHVDAGSRSRDVVLTMACTVRPYLLRTNRYMMVTQTTMIQNTRGKVDSLRMPLIVLPPPVMEKLQKQTRMISANAMVTMAR